MAGGLRLAVPLVSGLLDSSTPHLSDVFCILHSSYYSSLTPYVIDDVATDVIWWELMQHPHTLLFVILLFSVLVSLLIKVFVLSSSLLLFFNTEYARPTPPPKSGFHRYQFLLWAQPAGALLSLTEEERSSLGKDSTNSRLACWHKYTSSSQRFVALISVSKHVNVDPYVRITPMPELRKPRSEKCLPQIHRQVYSTGFFL